MTVSSQSSLPFLDVDVPEEVSPLGRNEIVVRGTSARYSASLLILGRCSPLIFGRSVVSALFQFPHMIISAPHRACAQRLKRFERFSASSVSSVSNVQALSCVSRAHHPPPAVRVFTFASRGHASCIGGCDFSVPPPSAVTTTTLGRPFPAPCSLVCRSVLRELTVRVSRACCCYMPCTQHPCPQ